MIFMTNSAGCTMSFSLRFVIGNFMSLVAKVQMTEHLFSGGNY